jgi:hypothetical protein
MENKKNIAFRTVLAHELRRAKNSFDEYILTLISQEIENKELAIKRYELYIDFVAHLYEFYKGCAELDDRIPDKIDYIKLDSILTAEAELHLHMARERIDKGYAPVWENIRSYYDVKVPDDFGKHWRYIRNRRNHVSEKRFTGDDISLSEFHEKYHQFIFMLFESPQWVWTVKDVEFYDWGDIEKFNSIVTKKR